MGHIGLYLCLLLHYQSKVTIYTLHFIFKQYTKLFYFLQHGYEIYAFTAALFLHFQRSF